MLLAKSAEIRKARIQSGYSLRALGEKAGINYATIANVERKKESPYPSTAKAICDALGKSFEDLFIICDDKELMEGVKQCRE
jgi:DNA-binding XRE family transcriptional regulator